MAKFQNFEKYNMLECYIESNKNKEMASNLYFERYPEREQPNPAIFKRLENNLINFGSFNKLRPKNYRKEDEENQEINVLGAVAADPTTSSRTIENDVGVSHTKTLKILKKK